MTTTSIVTIFGAHTVDGVDCLLDTMIDAQNQLGAQITWTEINTTHAHGTYTSDGATRHIAVLDVDAPPTIHIAAHQWVHDTTWTKADHDPSSTTTVKADQNTAETLAAARSDIHDAVAAHDDPHRREQYCRSALDYAATVLLAPDATPEQRDRANLYTEEAQGMLTHIWA